MLLELTLLAAAPVRAQVALPESDSTKAETRSMDEHLLRATREAESKDNMRLSPAAKLGVGLVAGAGIWTATFAWVGEPLQQYTQSHRTSSLDRLAAVAQPLGQQSNMVPAAELAFSGGLALKDAQL